jgi:hypothetical protein
MNLKYNVRSVFNMNHFKMDLIHFRWIKKVFVKCYLFLNFILYLFVISEKNQTVFWKNKLIYFQFFEWIIFSAFDISEKPTKSKLSRQNFDLIWNER